jgi:hypothetical protein
LNPFEEPVSLKGTKLVRVFAACLITLPENCQLPQKSFDTWSTPLAETGATEPQMGLVGTWYAQHHSTSPSLPYIIHAARTLIAIGALPAHRLSNSEELKAMAILKATEALGISADDCTNALILAGSLAHLAMYRRKMPAIERKYLRSEIEGIARISDYCADEILDEIQGGVGELKALGEYLFEQTPDDSQT